VFNSPKCEDLEVGQETMDTDSRNSQSCLGSALQYMSTPFTSTLKRTAIMGHRIPETRTQYLDSFSNETSRRSYYFPELFPVVATLVA